MQSKSKKEREREREREREGESSRRSHGASKRREKRKETFEGITDRATLKFNRPLEMLALRTLFPSPPPFSSPFQNLFGALML